MNNSIQKTARYHKAFKEVYLLINDLSSELYVRIPKSFIKIIQENMDESYDISIEELNTQGMMEETETMMSLIFRDFICSDELNEKLIEYDNKQIEQEIERYNNIFDNDDDNKKEETNIENENKEHNDNGNDKENQAIAVIKEENIIIKILNKIKSIFKKK